MGQAYFLPLLCLALTAWKLGGFVYTGEYGRLPKGKKVVIKHGSFLHIYIYITFEKVSFNAVKTAHKSHVFKNLSTLRKC